MTENTPNPQKRLYRSRKNQMIAGVASGFAEYLNLDPTLVRVLFVLLAFASAGFAILLYIILAIVVPVEEKEKNASLESEIENNIEKAANTFQSRAQEVANDVKTTAEKRGSDARLFVALALIIIGLIALSNELLPGFGIRWMHIWPIILIIFGLLLIIKKD